MPNRFLSNIKINDAYTFPASDGTNGQVIGTDGAGNLSFINIESEAGSTVIYKDNFSGDNSTVTFELAHVVSDEVVTQVYMDGVYQNKDTYIVSGDQITFDSAPPTGVEIEVISFNTVSTQGIIAYNAKNSTGSTIAAGTAVMAVGTDGNSGHILIAPMVADGSVEPKYFMGVTADEVLNGEYVDVVHFGVIGKINTSSFSDGDVLWLDPANNGGFTTTEPNAPNIKIASAIVLNSGTNGKIFVRVQGNEGLHELHDVHIENLANQDILVYNTTQGYWENSNTLGDITTGNITTDGTVDGVDISAFKAAYDVHTHVEGDITDFGNYLTNVTHDTVNNKLVVTTRDAATFDVDLAQYIDDTNLARLTSGSLDAGTGIATFTRDDATTFTVDFSALFDDTDTNDFLTGASFNTADGVLTLNVSNQSDVTVDLDGRYLESYTETDTLATVTARGNTTSTSITASNLYSNGRLYISSSAPIIELRDTDSTGAGINSFISYKDSGNNERGWIGFGSAGDSIFGIQNTIGDIKLYTNTGVDGNLSVVGNILLTGDATTTNQGRTIDFTGFDKEGTTDFTDRAYIRHTINAGGHSGSVLEISSQNDANDGIAFTTHASSVLKHNGNDIITSATIGSQSVSYATNAGTLNVTANDTFSGTYSLLWHAGSDVYSSSFMTINGATDTLNVPTINFSGRLLKDSNSASDTINIRAASSGQYFRLMSGNSGFGLADSEWTHTLEFSNFGPSTGNYSRIYNNSGRPIQLGSATNQTVRLTGILEVGTFSQSQTNNGEAWIGRAADRSAGVLTVQLGSGTGRKFEVVDYNWTTVEFSADDSGNAQAAGSMRAPIFYDSNNTAWYTDPASRSILNTLQLGGSSSDTTNLKLDVQGNMAIRGGNGLYYGVTTNNYNSWTTRMYASGSTQYLNAQQFIFDNQGYGSTTFLTVNTNGIYAPVFYDSSDTNYYVNPNGVSYMNQIDGPYFRNIEIPQSGLGSSYDERVLLLIPKVETNNSYNNRVHGKFTIGKTGGNVIDYFDVEAQSVYNNTTASFTSSGQRTGHKFVTCTYNGIKWLAIKFNYTANPYNYAWFHGHAITNFSTQAQTDMLKIISYVDLQSGTTVLNSEIYNSIADYTPSPLHKKISNGKGNFIAETELFEIGGDGMTPQLKLLYDVHASGAGWNTEILIGKTDDLPEGDQFPAYVPAGGYGTMIKANSDGVFFGMEEYSSGNYRPVIQWGDDNSDSPFRIKHENGSEFTVSYDGHAIATSSLRAPIFYDSDNTGYYLNPASLSYINEIRSNEAQANPRYDTAFYVLQAQHWYGDNSSQEMWLGESGNTVKLRGRLDASVIYDYNDTYYFVNPASDSRQNNIAANRIGINNSSSSSRYGISLYGGVSSGEPTYGLLFTGTSLGTHGSVTGSWATYFTMSNDSNRGWIFRRVGSGNAASISAGGAATFDASVTTPFIDIDKTSQYGSGIDLTFSGSNSTGMLIRNNTGATATAISFFYSSAPQGARGSITVSSTSTAYNTSSDYRLKENVVSMTGSLERVDQLKPARFNFIGDDKTVDGFLAHEAAEVVPEAVTGTKDEVDEEGNPVYQGIDQAKLVPLLVGAIQELKAEVEALKQQLNGTN